MDTKDGFGQIYGYRILEAFSASRWGKRFIAIYEPQKTKMLLWMPPASLSFDKEAWRLMCAELGAWSKLEIEGVLPVLDWGISDSVPYFATSFPSGRELSAAISDGIDQISALRIVANLSFVIEDARLRGVLHLGIDPRDIWVKEDLSVEVSGFGLWYVAREFPHIYPFEGPFLAPEQKDALRVSSATDVYALARMYQALVLKGCRDNFENDGQVSGFTDKRTPPFVFRCLEKDPAARCLTPGDFAGHIFASFPEILDESFGNDECPICRLQREIHPSWKNHPIDNTGRKYFRALESERAVKLLILILLVATIFIWWLALK